MIAGVATDTIVESTRIMKKPMHQRPQRGPRPEVGMADRECGR